MIPNDSLTCFPSMPVGPGGPGLPGSPFGPCRPSGPGGPGIPSPPLLPRGPGSPGAPAGPSGPIGVNKRHHFYACTKSAFASIFHVLINSGSSKFSFVFLCPVCLYVMTAFQRIINVMIHASSQILSQQI